MTMAYLNKDLNSILGDDVEFSNEGESEKMRISSLKLHWNKYIPIPKLEIEGAFTHVK